MPNIRRGPTARASRSCRSIGATPAPRRSRRNTRRSAAVDAALAMNEGSRAPDYASGPVWAIFDSAAVERRQLADPLSLYRRSARRVLPQSRYACRAGQESHGASPSEDAAEVSGGDGGAVQRACRQGQGRGLREAGHAQDRHAALLRGDRQGSACTIPTAVFGSTARRRSSTPTARSSPASTAGGEASGGGRSMASAAPRSTATSPGRTRRRSRRSGGVCGAARANWITARFPVGARAQCAPGRSLGS